MLRQHLKKQYFAFGAAFTAGTFAITGAANAANDFSKIAENIQISSSSIPGLLTALAYLFGVLLGVLGVMKIKDHVENPTNTPLKDGAIRLAAGGALFALPILYEAMFATIDNASGATGEVQGKLNSAKFLVN